MNKKHLITILSVAALMACSQMKTKDGDRVIPVKIATVEAYSDIRKEFSGVVEPVDFVNLAFRVNGQIINLPVIEGERVKKGQLIAEIDPRDLALQYAADKATFETAGAQLERNKRLLAKQAISKQEYEISEANYQRSKSAYELSSNNMRDTKLYAPFAGSIEKRLVENYQRVTSGTSVVTLVNTDKLRIKFTMPDVYVSLLKSDKQSFKVEFDAFQGHVFNASLEEFVDISTYGTGIPVSVLIDDPAFDRKVYDVKPGFTCNIQFSANVETFIPGGSIAIPLSAVFEDPTTKNRYVWMVKDNKVERRQVQVLSPTGDAMLLGSEGLTPGEVIVSAGVYQLVDGSLVKPVN